jgi:hypothetical protein
MSPFLSQSHPNSNIYNLLLIYSFIGFEANPWPFEAVQCYAFPMSGTAQTMKFAEQTPD